MNFLQLNADLSNKFESVKGSLHICIRKVSLCTFRKRYAPSENHYAMTYCFADIEGLKSTNFVKLLLSSIFFDILIANISWTVAQTPVNHINFWKSVMRTFRCIYTSCFNRLRFLAENSTKLQKMNFFGQFKDHLAQETWKLDKWPHFFHLLFPL